MSKTKLIAVPFVQDEQGQSVPGTAFFNKIKEMTGVEIVAAKLNSSGKYTEFSIKFPSYTDPVTGEVIKGDEKFIPIEGVNSFNTGVKSVCFIDVEARLLVLSIYDQTKSDDDYAGSKSTKGYIQKIITRTNDSSESTAVYENIIDLNVQLFNVFNIGSSTIVDKPLNTQFTIFPMYYYPRCMTVKRLYFVYNKTFKVGDVYCDTQYRAFYCLGGHIVYCNEDEQFNES